jgi:hypothetical protein
MVVRTQQLPAVERIKHLNREISELIRELRYIDTAIADFERLETQSHAKGTRSGPIAGAKFEALFEVKRKLRRRKSGNEAVSRGLGKKMVLTVVSTGRRNAGGLLAEIGGLCKPTLRDSEDNSPPQLPGAGWIRRR